METHGHVASEVIERLRALVESQRTLEDVVRWGVACRPPRLVARIVVQDEYTHDVVMPWEHGVFLVYDATWLGGLTAVAVWDHLPSDEELLEARWQRGWRPTPTATVSGEVVLGYAACRV